MKPLVFPVKENTFISSSFNKHYLAHLAIIKLISLPSHMQLFFFSPGCYLEKTPIATQNTCIYICEILPENSAKQSVFT